MPDIPTDYIIPLKQLNVASYLARLNALYSQSQRYAKLVTPGLPGMPDIPKMIKDYLQRLLDELLEKLREKLIELLTLLMAKLAKELIPVINAVIMVLNAVVDVVNKVVEGLFPYAKKIFQVMVACSIVYIVGKIICEVVPDFGAGMGAVTVFTTPIKNVLKFLSDGAIWVYEWLKPVAFAILSGMRKLLQYFGFLNIIMGFINMFKIFTSRDYAASTQDFINTAEAWGESTYPAIPSTEGTVSCTLPNGAVEQLSPQECLDAGGTFDGMDLLSDLADIENQISLHNSGATGQCLEGEQCIHLTMEECLALQEQGYCTWHSLYGDGEIIDCLLPDGSIAQMSPQECLDAGGQILTSDLLNQLLAQQDALLSQLNGLGLSGVVLDENLITSLLYPNEDVTVEDITEGEGVRYGFYGAQTGNLRVKDELDEVAQAAGSNIMMKKGGKIKRKPKKKNK